jgi:hypothetical protein
VVVQKLEPYKRTGKANANDLLAVGGTFAKAPTAVIESIPCE